MMAGKRFGIGYSDAIKNKGFENFTIGHELGHYFLGGHVEALLGDGTEVHYSESGCGSANVFEEEADFFAAERLMPKPRFKEQMRKAGEGFDAIEHLAGVFQTSLVATAIRFAQLGEDPIAVVISCGNRIEFCVLSDALKERRMQWPRGGDFLPPDSATSKFNRDFENVTARRKKKRTSSLMSWFEDAPEIEMKEDVVGLGHYGKTFTVIFTEEALDDEDEGEEAEIPSVRWTKRDRNRDC